MRLLEPADAVWLLNERRDTPAHVGGLLQCSKPAGAALVGQGLSIARSPTPRP